MLVHCGGMVVSNTIGLCPLTRTDQVWLPVDRSAPMSAPSSQTCTPGRPSASPPGQKGCFPGLIPSKLNLVAKLRLEKSQNQSQNRNLDILSLIISLRTETSSFWVSKSDPELKSSEGIILIKLQYSFNSKTLLASILHQDRPSLVAS